MIKFFKLKKIDYVPKLINSNYFLIQLTLALKSKKNLMLLFRIFIKIGIKITLNSPSVI